MKLARMTGGGVRSTVWTQMFADALELPIEVPSVTENAALGVAIAAGIGVGAYNGLWRRRRTDGPCRAPALNCRQGPR